jgi:hypothetical protein
MTCPMQGTVPFAAARCCVLPSPENAKLVEELRSLLQDTSSRDTFLLTVKALADIGPEARSAVPAIIRGAERLGLSKDIEQQVMNEQGPGVMIVECVERMLMGPGCPPRWAATVVGVPALPPHVPPSATYSIPAYPPAPAPTYAPPQPIRSAVAVETPAELIPPPSVR